MRGTHPGLSRRGYACIRRKSVERAIVLGTDFLKGKLPCGLGVWTVRLGCGCVGGTRALDRMVL